MIQENATHLKEEKTTFLPKKRKIIIKSNRTQSLKLIKNSPTELSTICVFANYDEDKNYFILNEDTLYVFKSNIPCKKILLEKFSKIGTGIIYSSNGSQVLATKCKIKNFFDFEKNPYCDLIINTMDSEILDEFNSKDYPCFTLFHFPSKHSQWYNYIFHPESDLRLHKFINHNKQVFETELHHIWHNEGKGAWLFDSKIEIQKISIDNIKEENNVDVWFSERDSNENEDSQIILQNQMEISNNIDSEFEIHKYSDFYAFFEKSIHSKLLDEISQLNKDVSLFKIIPENHVSEEGVEFEEIYVINLDSRNPTIDLPTCFIKKFFESSTKIKLVFVSLLKKSILITKGNILLDFLLINPELKEKSQVEIKEIIRDVNQIIQLYPINFGLYLKFNQNKFLDKYLGSLENSNLDDTIKKNILQYWIYNFNSLSWQQRYPVKGKVSDKSYLSPNESPNESFRESFNEPSEKSSVRRSSQIDTHIGNNSKEIIHIQPEVQYISEPSLRNLQLTDEFNKFCKDTNQGYQDLELLDTYDQTYEYRFCKSNTKSSGELTIMDICTYNENLTYSFGNNSIRNLISDSNDVSSIYDMYFMDTNTKRIMKCKKEFIFDTLKLIDSRNDEILIQKLAKINEKIKSLTKYIPLPLTEKLQFLMLYMTLYVNNIYGMDLNDPSIRPILGVWEYNEEQQKYIQIYPENQD